MDTIQKLQRAAPDVATAVGELALLQQVEQVVLHFFTGDLIGRTTVVFGESRHGVDIALLRALGRAPQHHVRLHLLA